MANSFGNKIKYTIFGQSHSEAVGVVIDGLPAGFEIDFDELCAFAARRAPMGKLCSSGRRERDRYKIVSGLSEGKLCGAPLCIIIENEDARPSDYEEFKDIPRPSHADFTAHEKFGGFNDVRGGGQFSGRLTAPLCAAGGIALRILKKRGLRIGAHVCELAGIDGGRFDPLRLSPSDLDSLLAEKDELCVLNKKARPLMLEAVEKARSEGDSVGGVIECAVLGLEAGIGEPMFDGLENVIARAVFAIPGIKGIEFGSGFQGSRLKGSQNNDEFVIKDGKISTLSNNAGGILGGLSTGMPLIFRAAVKPTPSIALRQRSVSLSKKEERFIEIGGRHEPCIALRAVPAIEAVTAMALLDLMS